MFAVYSPDRSSIAFGYGGKPCRIDATGKIVEVLRANPGVELSHFAGGMTPWARGRD